jgi:hypothetical protein
VNTLVWFRYAGGGWEESKFHFLGAFSQAYISLEGRDCAEKMGFVLVDLFGLDSMCVYGISLVVLSGVKIV